jgi:hypothetical protein
VSIFKHDFPRELSEKETQRLADVCDALFRIFEWEREQPVHVCEQKHGGKLIETEGSFAHEQTPLCHDCGRWLVRPQGGHSETWVCPSVSAHPLRAIKPDHAVECGRAE